MKIGNQPAFPHVVPGALTDPNHHAGMTYRQYLVGQALAGLSTRLLTVEGSSMLTKYQDVRGMDPASTLSGMAIEMADAVIKRLEAE